MTRHEDGMTVVELMVAMIISMVAIFAGFQALDTFTSVSASNQRRSDNTQKARFALDGLVRALRSQACPDRRAASLAPAIQVGTPTSIDFVTDLNDEGGAPQRRVVTYDATTRQLTEARYDGTSTLGGDLTTFAATPSSAGPTVDAVEPNGATPVFTYKAYDAASPPRPTITLPTPLSAADRFRVAQIAVEFRVGAATDARDRAAGAVLGEQVLVRSVDPADASPIPGCG